jgi:hypothetical protein
MLCQVDDANFPRVYAVIGKDRDTYKEILWEQFYWLMGMSILQVRRNDLPQRVGAQQSERKFYISHICPVACAGFHDDDAELLGLRALQ